MSNSTTTVIKRPKARGPATTFYHGSSLPGFNSWRPDRGFSDDADMLFLSQSPNVATRYGTVYRLDIQTSTLPAITVDEWFNGKCPDTSFIICGDGGYDFPVDTLVLREDPRTRFIPVDDVTRLDDGLAITHDPTSPSDRQFEAYLLEHCDGDIKQFQPQA